MKRSFFLLFALLIIHTALSAQTVTFLINDGLENGPLKDKINANLSLLLTEFNRAYDMKGAIPDFSAVSITKDAETSVIVLWDNMPFHCDEAKVVERIIGTYNGGWQVRNVPIQMRDLQGNDDYQELVIEMDGSGRITRINMAIGSHLYRRIMTDGSKVGDLRHRQMILDYVEQFRTAYCKKDIHFLDMVFSDDALIITGKVIQRKRGDRTAIINDEIAYTKHSKKAYLDRLKQHIFPYTKYIRVDFSDIRVTKHPSIEGYYGVLLKQGYESLYDGGIPYSDEGYLFMLWDFRDEDRPQIHVRTWQPYWMDEERTRALDENQIIDINSFRIGK